MFKSIIYHLNRLLLSPEKKARKEGVIIGENCNIQTHNFGSEPYLVKIGNHVQITSGVKFFTHGGGWVFRDKDPGFDTFGKIIIKNNVYIGNNALLMPGIIIGNNVIIGSGAVVTKSIADNMIVAGNPAKVIGDYDTLYKKLKPFNLNTKHLNAQEKKSFLLNLDESFFIHK